LLKKICSSIRQKIFTLPKGLNEEGTVYENDSEKTKLYVCQMCFPDALSSPAMINSCLTWEENVVYATGANAAPSEEAHSKSRSSGCMIWALEGNIQVPLLYEDIVVLMERWHLHGNRYGRNKLKPLEFLQNFNSLIVKPQTSKYGIVLEGPAQGHTA
jgi:hypothetical protein